MKTRILTASALFAAVTAVLSQVAIPLPGLVPINLATLSVFLCGALLGPKWGAISQLVYLCLGLIGIPVFSGFRAGPGVITGPTGGYLIGYVLAAWAIGLILTKKPARWMLPVSMLIGMVIYDTLGTAWYMFSTNTSMIPSLIACVFPFLPGDAVKVAVATFVCSRFGLLRFLHADAASSQH